MSDDIPDYLKEQKYTLPTFDAADKPGGRPKEEAMTEEELNNEVFVRKVKVGEPTDASKMPRVEWLLKGEPRDVQLEALRRSYYGRALLDGAELEPEPRMLRESGRPARGWGHFMQMRLGKTPTLLNEFMLLRRDHGVKRAVILSPNSYKETWVEEAETFGVDVHGMAFDSSDRDRLYNLIRKSRGELLVSVNYEALGYEKTMALLEDICDHQTLIAADESIFIKTFDSRMTKKAVELAKRCGIRRPMTGKPITQGPHDLWGQLRFAGALDGFNYHPFKATFCKMGGFQGKKVVGVRDPERLQEIIYDTAFLARRTEWMNTPGVDYGELSFTMTPEQASHYKRMEEDFITELDNGTIVSADQAVTKYLKLQQISSGFIIDETGHPHEIVPRKNNPKLQGLIQFLRNQLTAKALIFVHYTHSLDMLAEELAEFNPAIIRGQGFHKSTDRPVNDEKRRFNSDRNCRITLCQIQAARYGHTLVGSPDDPCLAEFWYENNYSLNDRSQGEERPQGAHQMDKVSIFDMYASPREREIVRALQKKEDVASLILNYNRRTGILPH